MAGLIKFSLKSYKMRQVCCYIQRNMLLKRAQFHFCMSKTDIRSLKITAYCNIPIVCGIFFFKCIASPFRIHELTHFFVQGPLSCHGHRAYCSQLSCCSWKMPAIPHQYNDFLQHCMHSQLKDISIVLWYI